MLRSMKKTLSLDDDVAAEIERMRRDRRTTYRDLVNEALRLGLRQLCAQAWRRSRFQTATVDLGASRIGKLDDISEALAAAERRPFDASSSTPTS